MRWKYQVVSALNGPPRSRLLWKLRVSPQCLVAFASQSTLYRFDFSSAATPMPSSTSQWLLLPFSLDSIDLSKRTTSKWLAISESATFRSLPSLRQSDFQLWQQTACFRCPVSNQPVFRVILCWIQLWDNFLEQGFSAFWGLVNESVI